MPHVIYVMAQRSLGAPSSLHMQLRLCLAQSISRATYANHTGPQARANSSWMLPCPALLQSFGAHVVPVDLHHVINDQNRLWLPRRSEPPEVSVEHGALGGQRVTWARRRPNWFKPPPVARPEDAGRSDRTSQLL